MSEDMNTTHTSIQPQRSRAHNPIGGADTPPKPGPEVLRPGSGLGATGSLRGSGPTQIQMDFGRGFPNPPAAPSRSARRAQIARPERRRDKAPVGSTTKASPPCKKPDRWFSENLEPWVGGLMVVLVGLASVAFTPL